MGVVVVGQLDAVTAPALAQQREQRLGRTLEVLLDVGDDDVLDLGLGAAATWGYSADKTKAIFDPASAAW